MLLTVRCEYENDSGPWPSASRCPNPGTEVVRVWMSGYASEDLDMCPDHALEVSLRHSGTVERL